MSTIIMHHLAAFVSSCIHTQFLATYQSGLAHGLGEVTAKALVLRLLYVRSH